MLNKLNDLAVRKLKPAETPYKKADGGGLYVHVTEKGSKLWRMAYREGGKQKLLSFGAYPEVSLAEEREKRDAARQKLRLGGSPGTTDNGRTFGRHALEYIASKSVAG